MDVDGMGDWFILRIVNGRYKLTYFCGVPKSTDKKGYNMKLRAQMIDHLATSGEWGWLSMWPKPFYTPFT